MNAETLTTQGRTLKFLLTAAQIVGPALLAIVTGYGAVQFSQGMTSQKITELENRTISFETKFEKSLDRTITREEFNQLRETLREDRETLREDMREIKTEVRAIRSDLNRGKHQ